MFVKPEDRAVWKKYLNNKEIQLLLKCKKNQEIANLKTETEAQNMLPGKPTMGYEYIPSYEEDRVEAIYRKNIAPLIEHSLLKQAREKFFKKGWELHLKEIKEDKACS